MLCVLYQLAATSKLYVHSHQSGRKHHRYEHLASQRYIELPQRQSWEKEDDDVGRHIESTLAQDDVVHIVTLAARCKLVPDHASRLTVEHSPKCKEGVDNECRYYRCPCSIPHELVAAA